MIYRLVLCVPVAALLRPAPAILLCGAVFSLLHVVYGNPGPDNLIAGFFLTWAYLRSESLLLPVALHSAGNLCALTLQVVSWYLLPPT
jgi:membrane protease YdiL (CAAX protease family)